MTARVHTNPFPLDGDLTGEELLAHQRLLRAAYYARHPLAVGRAVPLHTAPSLAVSLPDSAGAARRAATTILDRRAA